MSSIKVSVGVNEGVARATNTPNTNTNHLLTDSVSGPYFCMLVHAGRCMILVNVGRCMLVGACLCV